MFQNSTEESLAPDFTKWAVKRFWKAKFVFLEPQHAITLGLMRPKLVVEVGVLMHDMI